MQDDAGAERRETVEISQPPPLRLAEATYEQPSACNAADGVISVTSEGGLGRYEYRLGASGRLRDSVFTGLAAGAHDLTVYDQADCRFDTTLSLTDAGSDIVVEATVFAPACHDFRDGEIFLEVEGGAEPYEYSLDGVDYTDVPEFTGLRGGRLYTVFIRDFGGCVRVENVNVPAPAPLAMDLAGFPPDCGQANGAVEIAGRGGTRPYQFSLDGVAYQNRPKFDSLPPGLYVVSMIDTNDCILTDTIRLREQADLEIDFDVRHPGCESARDGRVAVLVEGGEPPYSYTLNDTLTQTDSLFTDLDAGYHNFVVEDARGCRSARQTQLIYLPGIGYDLELTHPGCAGLNEDDASGVIRVRNVAGEGPFQFSLNAGPFSETREFEDLSAGMYLLQVLDARNCFIDEFVLLRARRDLNLSFQVEGPACGGGGEGAAVVVSASGGAEPYFYSLNDFDYQESPRFEGLPAGGQEIFCLDSEGCIDWDTVTIDAQEQLQMELTVENASCPGLDDGAVSAEVSGGTEPYRYALNDTSAAQSEPNFAGLAPGVYTCYAIDAAGCAAEAEFEIAAPEVELLTLDPSCADDDGEITVSVLGAEGREVRYQLGEAAPDTSSTFTGLSGGDYMVRVLIGETCVVKREATLETAPGITADVMKTDPTACGAADGEIRVEAAGGLGELRYSLDGENWQDAPVFEGLTGGAYTVYVEDNYACRVELQAALAEAGNNIRLTFVTEDALCYGEATGSARLNAVAGEAPYTYAWPDGDDRAERGDLPAGEYLVTITDALGCAKTDTIRIGEPEALTLALTVDPISDAPGIIGFEASGGVPPYAYALAVDDTAWQSEAEIYLDEEGPFTALVRDANGCLVAAGDTMTVRTTRKELLTGGGFSLYPNPGDGRAALRAELARPAALTIALYDLQGRLLETLEARAVQGLNDIPVDFGQLPSGAYLLHIRSEGARLQTIKVMVR